MNVEVIVALVASGSALLVSMVTGILQMLQIKAGHRLDEVKRIEARASDLSGQVFQEKQEGLREACRGLQRFQDEILLLIKASPSSLVSDTQQKSITEARDQVLRIYQQYHPLLSSPDRENLNEARKKVVDIVLRLELERVWDVSFLTLGDGLAREIERASVILGNYHQQLLFSAVNGLRDRLIGKKERSAIRPNQGQVMKSARTNHKRTNPESAKPKVRKVQPGDRQKKPARAELTANELMFEAWKKLYETRRERLL